MRIALLQAAGTPGDVAANLAEIEHAARDAASGGARLLICPETFTSGYNIGPERIAELAEPADGPTPSRIAAIAREAGIAVLCGYPERDGERIYNSALLAGGDGAVLANYRKTHLFGDLDREAFTAGDAIATIAELDDVKVGLLICYDIEFPEAARRLANAGAELIAVPTALMTPSHPIANTLVPARALENQVWVAYANRVGVEGDLTYIGSSCVAGPDGSITRAGAEADLLFADIDTSVIATARERHSYLDDRRPELYP